ncbi:MAG: 2-dehydro-3-deoxy-D-gluconate 5-dehydrogenase KduD [Planctomycetota bacterium]|jgi:2-deoxy-D-gluconate 3-dehydrogenase|nr:2-dehydro-3-deoxy-D-gluconate 5-dehydrogenase KduD [Planctomycetota bacterium]
MILDLFSLKGKTAAVTGANTGLGQGIALALAEAGARTALVGRSPMDETLEKIKAAGGEAFPVKADLADVSVCQGIVDQTVAKYGGLDILVNNAGIIRRADSIEFTEKDWDDVLNVNLKSLFFLSQAAAKLFLKQGRGGKIINIASLLSYQGGIRVPSYTSSKSGVIGLTRLLANEWARHGICVNGIAPGYMVTNNTEALRRDPVRHQAILERIPAGRWGLPSDLGGTAVFLASPASDYLHGFTIAVDGGWLGR